MTGRGWVGSFPQVPILVIHGLEAIQTVLGEDTVSVLLKSDLVLADDTFCLVGQDLRVTLKHMTGQGKRKLKLFLADLALIVRTVTMVQFQVGPCSVPATDSLRADVTVPAAICVPGEMVLVAALFLLARFGFRLILGRFGLGFPAWCAFVRGGALGELCEHLRVLFN